MVVGIVQMQKGEPMAEIKVPIQVNLPDDWVEQIVDRLRNDPDAEWVEIIRCKDCKWYGRVDKRRFYRGMDCLQKHIDTIVPDRDFCSKAERRGEQDG